MLRLEEKQRYLSQSFLIKGCKGIVENRLWQSLCFHDKDILEVKSWEW